MREQQQGPKKWRRRDLYAAYVNYFEVPPGRPAYAERTVRPNLNWQVLRDASLISTCISATSFILTPLLVSTLNRYYLGVIAISVIIAILSTIVLYASWQMLKWEHIKQVQCQMAPHLFNVTLDFLRAPRAADLLTRLKHSDLATPEEKREQAYAVLADMLSHLATIFRQLVREASVSAALLIPASREGHDGLCLRTAMWSKPDNERARQMHEATQNQTYDVNAGVSSRVLQFGQSVLVRDTALSVPISEPHRWAFARSLMCVPVVIDERPDFMLAIVSDEANQFHRHYIDMARVGANMIAIFFKLTSLKDLVADDSNPR